MARDETENWMWSEAVDMLSRAERLHRQLFQPCAPAAPAPAWEPPVDMLETDHEVIIFAALPGVDPRKVTAVIEGGVLVVSGRRTLPPQLRTARIHRLELPQGRFERRVPLPPGHYDGVRSEAGDGCLVVTLRKVI
jgi:HSP20 family protein